MTLAFPVVAADRVRAWENDTTRTGSTYSSVPVDETASPADACASLCAEDAQCRSWTLVKQGNPDLGAGGFSLCLLKNAVPDPVADRCCISGVAGAPDNAQPVDIPKADEAPVSPGPQSAEQALLPPVHLDLTPQIFPLGKWPEGIAHDGAQLWVAMSGERRLYRINPDTGEIVQRMKVGRLPVGLASTSDGRVYAAVATDRQIWEQPPGQHNGRVLSRLNDYPQALTADNQAIWVLTWVGGSSGQTRVVRIDLANGRQDQSAILPSNGFDLVVSGDTVWTLHRYDGEDRCEIVGLDKDTLAETKRQGFSGFVTFLADGEHGLYAGGGQSGHFGAIVRLDPASGEETARYDSALPIAAMATGFDNVIAADMDGTIFILSGDNLTLLQTIRPTTGTFRPQEILIWGDQLFVTTHTGFGNTGSLVVLNGWRP
jgi:DNA-binding beta-propeller fold protein YncE